MLRWKHENKAKSLNAFDLILNYVKSIPIAQSIQWKMEFSQGEKLRNVF